MSQKQQRARHEALAREIAAWQSWTVQMWFTDAVMALMVDEPFRGPDMALEFGCLCSDGDRQRHRDTLDRHCVYVDRYEHDPKIKGALNAILGRAMQPRGSAYATIDRSVELESADEGVLSYRVRVDSEPENPRAWYAVQTRYVEMIERHARPDRWAIAQPHHPPDRPRPPFVMALRGKQGVGLIVPMTCPGSAIELAPPAETGAPT